MSDARIETEKFLLSIGAQPQLTGFEYVVDAVDYCMNHPGAEHNLTNELYPFIASQHLSDCRGVGWKRVERAMRAFVETLFMQGDFDKVNQYFGGIVSPITGKMTNSQFICTLILRVRHRLHGADEMMC